MWKLAYQSIIQGPPVAMGRPRITRTGRAYTPKTSRTYKDEAVKALKDGTGEDWIPLDGIFKIKVSFVHPRTKRLHLQKGAYPMEESGGLRSPISIIFLRWYLIVLPNRRSG